jgi:hypothetical protein
MPPFEIGLDEVAGEQQQKDDKPNQIEVDEQEHESVTGSRQKGICFLATGCHDLGIVKGESEAGEQQNQDDPDRAQMHLSRFQLRVRSG